MKTITLTQKEEKVLLILLNLDLDSIGFDDDEQDILNSISEKLKPTNKTSTTPLPFIIPKRKL